MATESVVTFVFGTSGLESYFEVLSIGDLGNEVAAIDITTMADTEMQYMFSSLKEGGSMTLEVQHDRTDTPTVGGAMETITVKVNGTQFATFSGGLQSYKITGSVGEKLTASAVFKVNGAVTLS